MTQCDRILDLLRATGPVGVTPLMALDEIGCMRLAARIGDLRALGYDITTTIVSSPMRGTKHWARYVLVESEQRDLGL